MLGDLGHDGTKRNKDIMQMVKFISKHVWEAELKKIQSREAVARSRELETQVREL
jgi:DNA-binding HxlR family transcriptional regulator